jgi:hypothetical protein
MEKNVHVMVHANAQRMVISAHAHASVKVHANVSAIRMEESIHANLIATVFANVHVNAQRMVISAYASVKVLVENAASMLNANAIVDAINGKSVDAIPIANAIRTNSVKKE